MKYYIYFHGGCFDGVASAAMLLYFLRLQGDEYSKFIPLTHPIDKKWWKNLKMKNPSAIVDISYHPKAAIWFDHHPTAFIEKTWEKKFRGNKWHVLDIKSPSCTGLIYRHLTKVLKVKPPKYISDLVKWADKIDRALFSSPKEAMSLKEPALQVSRSMFERNPPLSYQKYLIHTLSSASLKDISKLPKVKSRFLKYKKEFRKSLPKLRKSIKLIGKVAFADYVGKKLIGMRFAPYYFYPKIHYSMRLIKYGNNFIISAGLNKWNAPKKLANIGKFLEKKYGGGGHAYAGSASFRTKKEALFEAKKIADYLNMNV